jgi:hypothetical protein
MKHPPMEDEPAAATDEATAAAERAELSRQIERLQTEIDAVNQEWWKGEFGDRQSDEAKRQRDSLKRPMEDEKASKTARRDALAAQIIEQKQDKITAADFETIRERMRDLDENDPSPEWRQEFIRTFVKQVSSTWRRVNGTMDLHFDWEDLRRLVGKLGVETADLAPPRLSFVGVATYQQERQHGVVPLGISARRHGDAWFLAEPYVLPSEVPYRPWHGLCSSSKGDQR